MYIQPRIDRKKDKAERKILDSQERAFWDVHRPVVSVEGGREREKKKEERIERALSRLEQRHRCGIDVKMQRWAWGERRVPKKKAAMDSWE